VRYHTTLKDIAVSVLVLVSCAILCLYGMVHLGMGNPSQYIADRLMQALDTGNQPTFKAESIDRTFLKSLIINKAELSLAENSSVSASRVEISGGLPAFALLVLVRLEADFGFCQATRAAYR